jgi:hypothetical protein
MARIEIDRTAVVERNDWGVGVFRAGASLSPLAGHSASQKYQAILSASDYERIITEGRERPIRIPGVRRFALVRGKFADAVGEEEVRSWWYFDRQIFVSTAPALTSDVVLAALSVSIQPDDSGF